MKRAKPNQQGERGAGRKTPQELRLAALVESSFDAIIGASLEGVIEGWNPAAKRLCGYKAEQALGRPLSILVSPERSDELQEVLEKLRQAETIEPFDTVWLRKNGQRVDVGVSVSTIRDQAGQVVGVSAIAHDITSRRQEELRLHQLTHELGERVKQLTYLYSLSCLVQTPGIPPEEVFQSAVDQIPSAWRHPELTCARLVLDGEEFRTANFQETPSTQSSDIWIRGKQAGRIEVGYLGKRPARDEGGLVQEQQSLLMVIAEALAAAIEHTQAEKTLAESENHFRKLVETAAEWLWEIDENLLYTYSNPRVLDILGYQPEELLGRSFYEFLPEDEVVRMSELVPRIIRARTPFSLLEVTGLHKEGRRIVLESSFIPIFDHRGRWKGYRGIDRDITDRKATEQQLLHNAYHDGLTGLPNRPLFMDRLRGSIRRAKRDSRHRFAVLFLDLDHFKVVNDSLGHLAGDDLLLTVARRLEPCVRGGDSVARLGGDEFAILLDGVKTEDAALMIADRIQERLSQPIDLEGHEVFTSASIGIVFNSRGDDLPGDLLRNADTAMYRAKAGGRACYKVFDEEMHASAVALMHLRNDFRRAVGRDEFQLQYQPIVSVATGKIAGFEALVRWNRGSGDLVPPSEFIPIAEETGQIIRLDRWVLREACRQSREWRRRFPGMAFTLSVNCSGKQFKQADLVEQIDRTLEETEFDPRMLILEITESAYMDDPQTIGESLSALKARDIRLHVDDFGVGYSSLSHLWRLPIDALKIDASFVSSLDTQPKNLGIVRAIVLIARSLSMDVIAEGVETREQAVRVEEFKCDYAQGHYFSGPLDPEGVETLMAKELRLDKVP